METNKLLSLREFVAKLVHELDGDVPEQYGEDLYQEFVEACPKCDFSTYEYTYNEWLEKYYVRFVLDQ